MALYNTFKYGDGTVYTDPDKLVRYYDVVADPVPATGGLSFQNVQRVGIRITQSGGSFIIHAIRPFVDDGGYYPSSYDIAAGQENMQRVSIRFKFSSNSLFNLLQIRPIIEVRDQQPIG